MKDFIESTKAAAHECGQVHTMCGRRRPLAAICSSDIRWAGLRLFLHESCNDKTLPAASRPELLHRGSGPDVSPVLAAEAHVRGLLCPEASFTCRCECLES